MHPLPADQSGHRVIDGERASRAIAALARAGETKGDGRVISYQPASTPIAALVPGDAPRRSLS